MGLFSKKVKKDDKILLKEFRSCLKEINSLADDFRLYHSKSMELFEHNFTKKKTAKDMEQERLLFEKQFDALQKLKFQTDLLVDEGFRLIRNEAVLTEKDRVDMKLKVPTPPKVVKKKTIRISNPKKDKRPKKKPAKKNKTKTVKKKTVKKKSKTAKKTGSAKSLKKDKKRSKKG